MFQVCQTLLSDIMLQHNVVATVDCLSLQTSKWDLNAWKSWQIWELSSPVFLLIFIILNESVGIFVETFVNAREFWEHDREARKFSELPCASPEFFQFTSAFISHALRAYFLLLCKSIEVARGQEFFCLSRVLNLVKSARARHRPSLWMRHMCGQKLRVAALRDEYVVLQLISKI